MSIRDSGGFAIMRRPDPDDSEREKSLDTALRIIADYMGVALDDLHITCSCVVGGE